MDNRVLHETLANGVEVLRWPHRHQLPEDDVTAYFSAHGIQALRWTIPTGTSVESRVHACRRIIFCVAGTLTVRFLDEEHDVSLGPGDRLTIPSGLEHRLAPRDVSVTCIQGEVL